MLKQQQHNRTNYTYFGEEELQEIEEVDTPIPVNVKSAVPYTLDLQRFNKGGLMSFRCCAENEG